jgi:hypothetical protein
MKKFNYEHLIRLKDVMKAYLNGPRDDLADSHLISFLCYVYNKSMKGSKYRYLMYSSVFKDDISEFLNRNPELIPWATENLGVSETPEKKKVNYYKTGTKFMIKYKSEDTEDTEEEAVLACVSQEMFAVIRIKDGNRVINPIKVDCETYHKHNAVPEYKLREMMGSAIFRPIATIITIEEIK